ncbi:MAG: TRAP transporter small permease [Calditrichia bacterium]
MMEKVINRIDRGLAGAENFIIIVLLSIMVILAFTQVILRNFFSTGILWADIFLRHLVLWVGFIGASLATREGKHINIDILTRLISKARLPYIRMIIDVVSAIVCFILAKAGVVFLLDEIKYETILFLNVPAWIFQLIIPVGFALIAFRFILQAFQQLFVIRNTKPGRDADEQ